MTRASAAKVLVCDICNNLQQNEHVVKQLELAQLALINLSTDNHANTQTDEDNLTCNDKD